MISIEQKNKVSIYTMDPSATAASTTNKDNISEEHISDTEEDSDSEEDTDSIEITSSINDYSSTNKDSNTNKLFASKSKVNFQPLDINIRNALDKWAILSLDLCSNSINIDRTILLKKRDKVLKSLLRLLQLYVSNNQDDALKVQLGADKAMGGMFTTQDQVDILESSLEGSSSEIKQLKLNTKSDAEIIEQLRSDLIKIDRIMALHMDLIQYQLGDLKMKGSKLAVVEGVKSRDDRIQARVDILFNALNVKIEQAQIGKTRYSFSSQRSGYIKGSNLTLEELNDVITRYLEANAGSGGNKGIPETPDQKCMFGPLISHFKSNRNTSSTTRNKDILSFARYSVGPNARNMIYKMKKRDGTQITLENLNIIAEHAIMRVNIKMKAARTLDYKTLFEENERTKGRKNHVSLLKTTDIEGYAGAMLITPVDDGGKEIGLVVCIGGYYNRDESIIWQQVLNRTWQGALGKSDIKSNVEGGVKLLRKFIPLEIVELVLANAKLNYEQDIGTQLKRLNMEIYYSNTTSLFIDISNCTSMSKRNESRFLKHKIVNPFIKSIHTLTTKSPFAGKLFLVDQIGDCAYIVPTSPGIKEHAELSFLFAYKFIKEILPKLNESLDGTGMNINVHCGLSCGSGHLTFEYNYNRLKVDFNGPGTDMAAKCEAGSGSTSHIDKLRGMCDIAMAESYILHLTTRGLFDEDNITFSYTKYNLEDLIFTSFGPCEILGHGKPSVKVFGYTCKK